jgi:GT2 family glycosyltransferase
MSPAAHGTDSVDVAVVIPCRNDAAVLRLQLEALARQSSTIAEVVVADNGPTPELASIVIGFDGRLPVRVVDASTQRGRGHACNVGARASTASLLLFVDADDVVDERYVEEMRSALGSAELVGARLDLDRLNDERTRCYRRPPQLTGLGTGFRPFAYGCSIGIRREAFERIGGFDDRFVGAGEDIDFCYRAAGAGAELVYVPSAVVHYRLRVGLRSIWRQAAAYGAGEVAVFEHHRASGMTSPGLGSWKSVVRSLGSLDACRRRRGIYLLAVRVGAAKALVRARRATS